MSDVATDTGKHAVWLVRREVSVDIAASPGTVFDLVSDVTRIGEWSPECHGAEWQDDRRGLGARFTGHNRWGRNRWSRVCEVVAAEPGREFAYRTVPGFRFGPSADSSVWGFSIEPIATGSRLTQSLQPVKVPQAWFRPFIRRFMAQHLDMREQMSVTLAAIKAAAEAAPDDR
ncbi:MAG TPA: SRPBCC family protein [Acidimicrobiales bacterium]|nr:SRPBCC family protein [Acidimicrobiales bacterium]